MRILQVIPYFYPAWRFGGPVRVAYEVSKELVERGHSVVVYTSDIKDANARVDARFERVDGINIHYFKNLSISAAMKKLFFTPSLISTLNKDAHTFDIAHIHGNRTTQSPILHYFLKKNAIPYVVQAHGGMPSIGRPNLSLLFDKLVGHRFLRDASRVIALTGKELQQYMSIGISKEKISIVPNGLDLSKYNDMPLYGCFRKKFSLGDRDKMILYLGRIHRIKGIDVLVKAFARISSEIRNIKLVIAGPDDGYLDELWRLVRKLGIEDDVLIVGPLYGKDKIKAYVDADVYILPSRYETFPITILEAIACGTPIILTDSCGASDYFGNKVGLVVNLGTKHLTRALHKVLQDEELRSKFRDNCKIVIRRFSISNVVAQLESIYEEIRTTNAMRYVSKVA